jgi:hypothetical protein
MAEEQLQSASIDAEVSVSVSQVTVYQGEYVRIRLEDAHKRKEPIHLRLCVEHNGIMVLEIDPFEAARLTLRAPPKGVSYREEATWCPFCQAEAKYCRRPFGQGERPAKEPGQVTTTTKQGSEKGEDCLENFALGIKQTSGEPYLLHIFRLKPCVDTALCQEPVQFALPTPITMYLLQATCPICVSKFREIFPDFYASLLGSHLRLLQGRER